MKKDPVAELRRTAEFLERCNFARIDTRQEKLERAVELSSPQRMRELEKTQAKDWALTKQTRQDKPFVRTATSGGWKASLSGKSVALLEAQWGALMTELGYELSSPGQSDKRETVETST